MPDLLNTVDDKRGLELVQLIEGDLRDRNETMRTSSYIRNLYYGMRYRTKDNDGQSDIHLPVLAEKIESIVAKEMNAFWAADPHAHAQRVPKEFDEEETAAVERKVNWAVESDIPNLYATFEGWLRNRHLDSVAVTKIFYNYRQRNALIVEEVSRIWRAGQTDLTNNQVPADRPKLPVEIMGFLYPTIEIIPAKGYAGEEEAVDPEADLLSLQFLVNFTEQNVDYEGAVIQFAPSRYSDKIEVRIYRPIEEKDNVEVQLVEFEDIIVPYRASDLQSAERVTQQYWITLSELEYKRNYEGWALSKKDLELLRSQGRSEKRETVPGEDHLQEQKDRATGQNKTSPTGSKHTAEAAPQPFRDEKILVFEVYTREDLDGDGIYTEVIYQIPYALKKIVYAQHLEEVFPHGRRPFAAIHSVPISNRWYGWSLGQFLAPLNLEADIVLNSVNDSQELINNPFFFYVPHAFPGSPKKLGRLKPGQGIPIGEINGVIFPQFPQQPLANLSAMDSVLLWSDRITVSPQTVGSSQVRNAPRTARGTLALLSEAGAKVDSFIMAAQKGGWAELMYQIYALYEAFGSEEKWQAVTGRPKPAKSSSYDLRNRIEFTFKGNTVNTNREVRRSLAQVLYNTLITNPLYASDPHALQALTINYLRNFSEGAPNIEPLIPKIPGEGAQRQPISQQHETLMMLQGMPVDVHPFDDDVQHIEALQKWKQTGQFNQATPAQIALVAAHESQHQRALIIKQQQMQLQPNGQANNVPTELGNLEGGIQA